MALPWNDDALADVAGLMARAAALFVLGQMRLIEEQVADDRAWWPMLRAALERFTATGDTAPPRAS